MSGVLLRPFRRRGRRPAAWPAVSAAAALAVLVAVAPPASSSSTVSFSAPVEVAPAGGAFATEPSVAVDGHGDAFAVTIAPGRTDRYRSPDGGRSYEWSGMVPPGPALGSGRDADIAVAPERNARGHYTIYAVDLWQGSVTLEVSTDGGATWRSNVVVAHVPWSTSLQQLSALPLQERPWIVAEGASTAYITYVATGMYAMRCVAEPFPACGAPVQLMDLTPAGQGVVLYPDFWPGGLALDLERGRLYQVVLSVGPTGRLSRVWVAISTDGGLSFENVLVHDDPDGDRLNWFFAVPAVDSAGNVYIAWSDGFTVALATSTDGGESWAPPVTVNGAPSGVARLPWIAAGSEGILDLVWYGAEDPDGTWYAYFAQVRNAVVGTPRRVNRDPDVLQARLSEERVFVGGLTRDLLDMYEVAVDPTDGAAVTAFTTATGRSRVLSTRQCAGPSAIEGRRVRPC